MRVRRRFTVPFRRKREGKTDYHARLSLLKSDRHRLVVRRTSNHILAQIVAFDVKGDRVLAQADSRELAKMKWPFKGNLPSSYLTGYLLAMRAKKQNVAGDCVLDIGFHVSHPGSRVYAVLKGCVDGGLTVPHSDNVLPSEERVSGTHVAEFAKQASGSQFSKTKKEAQNITALFAETKKAIEQA